MFHLKSVSKVVELPGERSPLLLRLAPRLPLRLQLLGAEKKEMFE